MLLQEGVSPLYIASQKGHLQIVQLLIEYGALVNQASSVSCVDRTHIIIVIILNLASHCLPNLVPRPKALSQFPCFLHATLRAGRSREGLGMTLGYGPPYREFGFIMLVYIPTILIQSGQGDTALIVACYNGRADIARILLDQGATIDYKNRVRSI